MIDKIKCENRIGNDIHKELIAMFKEIQNGWKIPLHISEEEYNKVRNNKKIILIAMLVLLGLMQLLVQNILVDMQEDLKQTKLHQEISQMKLSEIYQNRFPVL